MPRPKIPIQEADVIRAVGYGYTLKEIAEYLDVSYSYIVKNWRDVIWRTRSEISKQLENCHK
jgi:DNA-binding CsgD family transcriptional regulator